MTERRFLAEVEHPSIVRIYNFVRHPDPVTGIPIGYIVMEYVGGRSLKDLLVQRRAAGLGPLPATQAIAYLLQILPALAHLHDRGLLYCDFKPDNVLQTEQQLKLIDLGGVRRKDDQQTAIYGTVGYQAPEIADRGASTESDVYTIGRTLAVLCLDFTGFSATHLNKLPTVKQAPLLAKADSLHRLLRRATNPDPRLRFRNIAELTMALTQVLHELMAAEDGQPHPVPVSVFSTQFWAADQPFDLSLPELRAQLMTLPVPLPDPADPGARFLSALVGEPFAVLATIAAARINTPEVRFRVILTRIMVGDLVGAARELAQLSQALTSSAGTPDWRITWYRALIAMAARDIRAAGSGFEAVCDLLPGEAAPKLAIAACAEHGGQVRVAQPHYETVWRTDRSFVAAAFGLARCRLAQADRVGAVTVLESVPAHSSWYGQAQATAVRTMMAAGPAKLNSDKLLKLRSRIQELAVDSRIREQLGVSLLEVSLAWRVANPNFPVPPGLVEQTIRRELEKCYRSMAKKAEDRATRVALIDQANAVRPLTLF